MAKLPIEGIPALRCAAAAAADRALPGRSVYYVDAIAELAVVIPTAARLDVLAKTLSALERQRVDRERFRTIVAIDAAHRDPDAVRARVAQLAGPAAVVTGERAGASATRNAGWHAASEPLVLFLGDDIVPGPELVAEHLGRHRARPETTVAVLGHVRWSRELRVTPFMRWLEQGIQFDYPRIEGTEAGWGRFYTANVSVKRALLEAVDGFDEERFPFGHEDLDIALRMDAHGLRLLYDRDAVGEHLHPMDLDFWRGRVARIAASEWRFQQVHPEIPPYFKPMFERADQAPIRPARLAPLAWVVRPGTPLLGTSVWRSLDAKIRKELAPHFLRGWEQAERGEAITDAELPTEPPG